VTQPATLTATVASTTNVSCFGGNNGAINITATGGTTAYSFNWGAGLTTQNRTGLAAGTYTVSITDANACSTTASATITQPAAALSANVASSTNIMCYGANNGTINVTVTGGTTAYSYNWGGGIITQNRTGLAAGTYTLTVTDANSCTTTTSATITSPASAMSATTVITNVSCAGNSTGTIDLTTIGGTSPYAFNWGSGVTTEDRNNLLAGTYTVTITDANSCTLTKSATVTQAPVLTAVIAPTTNVSCFGGSNGSMTLTASGGTPFYSYNWGGGITTQNRTNLTAGTYQVIVTDVNGCSASASATITQPATALSASVVSTTNIACYGGNTGSITTSVNGGTANYNYNWGGGVTTQNRTGLTAGTYTLTVTDANSCTATATAIITQPSSGVSVTISTLSGVQCYGGNDGNVSVNATGGTGSYTYNWSDGSSLQNRTGLTAGTYVLTLTDGNGCSATTNALVNQPAVLQAAASVTNVSCNAGNNGAIALAISGGTPAYSVLWSNGATTRNINTLLAGTYTVTVTDAHSCSLTRSAQVTEPSQLVVTHVTTDVRCNGGNTGAIDNTITGGTPPYASLWNTSHTGEDLQGVVAGNYATTITDANHCTAVIRDTIIQPAALGASLAGTNPRCLGNTDGSINLTVTGGTTPMQYIWTTGVTVEDLSNLGAGSYSVLITDANNCTLTGTTTLAVVNPLLASEVHTDVSCYSQNDGIINVAATGGATPYTYLWSNGDAVPNIGNLSAGSYSVTVTDNNGCTAGVGPVTITEPAGMNLTIASTNISCYGTLTGSISPVVTGGTLPYHYQWNNGSQASNLPAVAAGSYAVTVTDAHGCSQVATALITTLPALTGDAIVDPLPCTNATGGIDLNTGGGTAPYTYQWNNGVTTEDQSSVHPGTYTVVITDANGCTFDTTFVIANLNSFTVSASGGGTITLGQTIDLHVTSTGSPETGYNWTPTYGMPCSTCSDITIQPGHPTLYTVTGIDTNGCTAQDTVSVDVIEDHTLFPPNAFTPNGDGNNDVFQLFGNLAGIKKFNIKIFDRWGELVYESDEPSFSWDGTYKGQLIGPTVCVFVMQVTFLDGYNDKVQKGSITVLR
jgi:gliding motility-associated-like protein